MKVVWSWLNDLIDLSGHDVADVAERWTLAGLEVDGFERIGDWWDDERLIVGAVVRVEPHPDADRLVLAWVDHGGEGLHRVVTGAPNLFEFSGRGDLEHPLKVVFAREGSVLYDGHAEGWRKMTLVGRPVRGIMSDAMVCSEKEIGLSEEHEGILLLDDDVELGVPISRVLGDAVVDMDLTANYAYAANMVGLARETAAILGIPFREPELPLRTAGGRAVDMARVQIADAGLCPRYIARIVRGVTIGPSPERTRRRLRMAGMRPINNVVDSTNYAMLEWGEPLHAFDYDWLVERAGGDVPVIQVRPARPGERIKTLDGENRSLEEQDLLICDAAGPIAVAGVMGGIDTEVRETTRNVLLEAASFDPISIRRTGSRLRLATESAWRFGRTVPPHLAEAGSRCACRLMQATAGGEVVDGAVDEYPAPAQSRAIEMPIADLRRVLGAAIPDDEAIAILRRLGFEATLRDGLLTAVPPPHRVDQAIGADIIEEVARIHGYDRLPSSPLAHALPEQRDHPELDLEEAARDALADFGLQEIVSYRLTSVGHEALLDADGASGTSGAGEPDTAVVPGDAVLLANPISPERSSLRRSILIGLVDAASANLRFRDRVALFELGPVFRARPHAEDGLPAEDQRAGVLLAGPVHEPDWRDRPARDLDFFDAKGAVESLLEALCVSGASYVRPETAHPSLHPGRTAEVLSGEGASLGYIGELHPAVRANFELGDRTVAAADLDMAAIVAARGGPEAFRQYSSYPAVLNDLALVVAEDVPAGEVEAAIRDAGGPLLVECRLFDVYRGEQVGRDKKSLAFSLAFQAPDKTLPGKAVDGLRARIVRAVGQRCGAELR